MGLRWTTEEAPEAAEQLQAARSRDNRAIGWTLALLGSVSLVIAITATLATPAQAAPAAPEAKRFAAIKHHVNRADRKIFVYVVECPNPLCQDRREQEADVSLNRLVQLGSRIFNRRDGRCSVNGRRLGLRAIEVRKALDDYPTIRNTVGDNLSDPLRRLMAAKRGILKTC